MRIALALLLAGCLGDRPASTDAGPDPEISACCNWFLFPLGYDRPGKCLADHTAPGECRWLSCLGGLEEYSYCRPGDP